MEYESGWLDKRVKKVTNEMIEADLVLHEAGWKL